MLFVFTSASKSLQGAPTVIDTHVDLLRCIYELYYRVGSFLRRHTRIMSLRRISLSILLLLQGQILPWLLRVLRLMQFLHPHTIMLPFQQFAKGDSESQRFLNDPTAKALFENAKPLNAVHSDDYVAISYVGGTGAAIDLPTDETNIQLANKVYQTSHRKGPLTSHIH